MYLCGLNLKTILKHGMVIINQQITSSLSMHRRNYFLKKESVPDDETIVPIELDLMNGTSLGAIITPVGISVVVYISD